MKNKQKNLSYTEKISTTKIKIFESEELPIKDDNLVPKTRDVRREIIKNYSDIEKASKNILNYCIDNAISTPITYHNLFFYIEICLKLKLLLSSNLSVEELERHKHSFTDIISSLKECTIINFDELNFLLRKIKDKRGKQLTIDDNHHFKYNKKLKCNDLIFNLKLSDNDIEIIKEVIEWIDLNI